MLSVFFAFPFRRLFSSVLIALCLFIISLHGEGRAREIADMTGRSVEVPEHPQRLFSLSYPLTVLLYALAPDLLVAANFPIADAAKPYLPDVVTRLPAIGAMMGMGPHHGMNPEEIMAKHPDLLLAWVDPMGDTQKVVHPITGSDLPIVFVKLTNLADYPAALRFVGHLLGREARAEELATYIEKAQEKVAKVVASVPEGQRPRVYYAEGRDGLATDCAGSFHSESIDVAGGINVEHCPQTTLMGLERVTLEQIVADRPDILLVQDPDFAKRVAGDPAWAQVKGKNHVIVVPHLPYNWIDRPPSFMRALAIQWLANRFYPDKFPLDLRSELRTFHSLFFGVSLSDHDVNALLH
ncbi:ABC transporter substrate-binding protein [Beijerinckia mobilis]|uniref:ABC transporter substrate-binding protein n=1 Tax=Beijerinckia mobilis TaxID=231434 RepID=UPI0006909681|nr:ABC transporter substrate-binding protein [Beijerinckia mobilis]